MSSTFFSLADCPHRPQVRVLCMGILWVGQSQACWLWNWWEKSESLLMQVSVALTLSICLSILQCPSPTHNITARTSVTVLWSPYYYVGVRFSYVGEFKGAHVKQPSGPLNQSPCILIWWCSLPAFIFLIKGRVGAVYKHLQCLSHMPSSYRIPFSINPPLSFQIEVWRFMLTLLLIMGKCLFVTLQNWYSYKWECSSFWAGLARFLSSLP